MATYYAKKFKNRTHIKIGYARVSSTDNRQELGLEVQKEALKNCDIVFVEKDSGGKQDRPKLKKAFELARQCSSGGIDTTLVVYKLDRLTRKMLHLSAIIEELMKNNIRLQSIHEQIETDSLTGRFFCLMLGYVAEWELQAISERTKDGLRKAKQKGVKLGNKGISKTKEKQIVKYYLRGKLSVRKIARQLNISTATVYSVLRRNNVQVNRQKPVDRYGLKW